jgi:deazaflavin-dependent oxidoreductase (nitroreductase family)
MTVKVPPKGTRGIPFPRFMSGFANRMTLRKFRQQGEGRTTGGLHTFLLETIGAKSGEVRQAMLGYIEESADSWLVMASLAGAARNPGWLHNLAKTPEGTIEFGDGRRVAVRAESLEDADLEQAWERIGVEAPEYVGYRSKTDRHITVIRLERR